MYIYVCKGICRCIYVYVRICLCIHIGWRAPKGVCNGVCTYSGHAYAHTHMQRV